MPAFLLALFALALGAVVLAPSGSQVAAWWPAAGLSVGVLAVTERRARPALLAGVLLAVAAANLVGGRPLLVAVAFGGLNALEAGLAAWWLTRHLPADRRPTLACLADLRRLVAAAALGASAAATVASATVCIAHGAAVWPSYRSVAAAHCAAVLVLTPMFLHTRAAAPAFRWEALGQWAVTVAVAVAVFGPGQRLPLAFLVLPPLLWAALRGSVRRAAAQVLAVGVLVAGLTARGGGPFAGTLSPVVTGQLVQVLLITTALVVLTLAVVVATLQQALRELADRKEFDDAVLETVGVGVLACDATGRVVLRNRAQRRITRVADDEQVTSDQVATRLRVLLADGTPLPAERSPLRQAMAGAELDELPVRIGRAGDADADLREVLVTARRITGSNGAVLGAVASSADVTDERRVQTELRDSAAFHDAVLAATPDLIDVVDAGGTSVWSSRSAVDVLGHSPEQVLAMGGGVLAELVHPDDLDRLRAADLEAQGVTDGEVVQVRYRLRHPDGTYRWLARRATPFARGADGTVTRLLGVARDITDAVLSEERLAQAALHDPLTGLPNRRLLTDRLSGALARGARADRAVSVLFCDLDGFKHVNDTAGHAAGDAVLVATAQRLRRELRQQDTVARVGGDEFVVVLEPGGQDQAGHEQQARAVVARLRRALAEPVLVGGTAHTVSVSIGTASGRTGDDPEAVLDAADREMYRAKAGRAGRARPRGDARCAPTGCAGHATPRPIPV